jgi:hypothetical protein
MSQMPQRRDHDRTPVIAYMLLLIVACVAIAAVGVMWGITQDQNWHGFGGVITVFSALG